MADVADEQLRILSVGNRLIEGRGLVLANTCGADRDAVVASTKNQDLGRAGEKAVCAFFDSKRFATHDFPQELDLGTDIEIDLREVNPETENAEDLGFPVRCQVKTGESFFDEKGLLDDQGGWWFRCDIKHFNYWTAHKNRFFLILQTGDMQVRYWQWLDYKDLYQTIGQNSGDGMEEVTGYKLFVPKQNVVNDDFCSLLLEEAHKEKLAAQLASSSDVYRFDISEFEAGRWARYALMLPELTKPHENKGFDHAITWAEALALCVCQDPRRWDIPGNDFSSFAKEYDSVPSIEEAQTSKEAGWRFTAGYYSYLFEDDMDAFSGMSGLTDGLQAAKTVVVSAKLFCERKFEEAISLIDAQIESSPAMDSVDEAWLLMQKGNCLCELARWDEGRAVFDRCRMLAEKTAQSDQTAQMLRDNATSALFHMESLFIRDLGSVIAAYDSSLSRFSLRRDAVALRDLLERDFKNWGLDESRTIAASDTVKTNFQVSCNVGLLSGNAAAYRSALSNEAIIDLVAYNPAAEGIVKDLIAMIDAGDAKHLQLSANRVIEEKSPDVPYAFINAISPRNVTPSTIRSAFTALIACGDYLADEGTSDWFDFLKRLLEEPEDFLSKFSIPNSFSRWSDEAIKCLYAMRYQLTPEQLIWLSGFFCSCSRDFQIVSYQVEGILRLSAKLPKGSQRLEEYFETFDASNWLYPILEPLLYRETEASREAIHQELISGDIANIDKIGLVGLREDETEAILELALDELGQIAVQSKNGSYLQRGVNYGRLAGMILFESAAGNGYWDKTIAFLEAPLIDNREKISLSKVILDNLARVPVDIAERFVEHEDAILSSVSGGSWMFASNDKAQEILSALIDSVKGISGGFENAIVEKLLCNEKLGPSEIRLLAHPKDWELPLLGLCVGESIEYAREAFMGFVLACCANEEKYSKYKRYIANRCMHGGKCFPRSFLNATFEVGSQSEQTKEILHLLTEHKSATIRFHAESRLRAFGSH